ncbi:hypothetical protein [Janthinobacterium sp. RB2P8]|uniref:hypothetical protein n=1 Tax=Janthinobacterium sp. RB2P8 TaxID=3424191 RepID=UPI003F274B73
MASTPPLRIWLYSALLAVSVVALLALQRHAPWLEPKPEPVITKHTQRFLASAYGGEMPIRVLGLGSSLLWAATPPSTMNEIALLPGISWMRMTKPGKGLGALQASLMPIENKPPNVLVIEENLLFADSTVEDQLRDDLSLLMRNVAYKVTEQAHFAPQRAYVELADQKEPLPYEEFPQEIKKQLVLKNANNLQTIFSHGTINLALTDLLQRLSQRGIHIIVLELRRSELVEQVIAPQKKRWQEQLRLALPPGPQVSYLASPQLSPQELYFDGSHMNAAGARLFAPWWQAQLQQLRDER